MTPERPGLPGTRPFDVASPPDPGWLGEQLGELLDFCAAAADWRHGGFDGLTTTGQREPGPKRLYATARMTYGFALGAMLGRPGCTELADHGLRALRTIFRDSSDGGWFAELSSDGREVTVPRKETYSHAFVLLAASTAVQAGMAAGDLLEDAAVIFDRWLWDEQAGLCVDSWDQGWNEPDSYRGINANMHTVEAFLGAYFATGRPSFLRRAQSICARLISFAAAAQWRIPEHFTQDWTPLPGYHADRPADEFRPFGSTPGHGVEWARLLLQLRLIPGGDSDGLLAAATALFGRAVADGWDAGRCGFAYTVDWQGAEVSPQRLHWPLAEAIGRPVTCMRRPGSPNTPAGTPPSGRSRSAASPTTRAVAGGTSWGRTDGLAAPSGRASPTCTTCSTPCCAACCRPARSSRPGWTGGGNRNGTRPPLNARREPVRAARGGRWRAAG